MSVTKIVVEHRDGHGPNEGMLKIVRELMVGKWHTDVKTKNMKNPLEKPNKPGKATLCNGCNISGKHLVEIFGTN